MSSHGIWKIETFTEEDTRYKKHCTYNSDVSIPFKAGTLGPHTVLPIAIICPVIFSWIFEGLKPLPFEKILVLRKSISHRASNQGWTGQTFSHTTLCDAWHVAGGVTLWWCSCQSPVAHSCSLRSHPNSLHRRMISLTWNLMQILCSIGSVTLNVMATSTHDHSGASTAPLTSAGKWSLFSHAHSSPSSLADRLHWCDTYCSYINNGWTLSRHTWYTFFQLTVLISVGFFPQKTTTLSSHQM